MDTMKNLRSSPRRLARFERCLVASVLASLPATAMAEGSAPYPVSPTITYTPMQPRVADPALPPPRQAPTILPPAPIVTDDQLHSMVDMFSSSPQEVMRRLWLDPELGPLALEAVEHKKRRERHGKAMTTIGLVMVGIGVFTGISLMLAEESFGIHVFDDEGSTPQSQPDGMKGVALGSLIFGIGIALPGIGMWGQTSSLEKQAIRRYRQQDADRPWPPPARASTSLASPSKAFQIQLLSLRF
jgi:hypothetical protein